MEIPKEYQQLCKDLAKVLRKFNNENGWMSEKCKIDEKIIYKFSGRMSVNNHKMSDIQFHWENGRHGDSQGRINIRTDISIDTEINEE